jgi:general secretion pathway protein C
MNQISAKILKIVVIYVLLPFAVVKIAYTIVTFLFLQKDDVVKPKIEKLSYHYSMDLGSKILSFKSKQPVVQQIEATNRIKDINLKGTYLDGKQSFIVIEDQLGTTFLYKGDRYVGYVLKEIYDGRAIFEKNGKNYDIVIDEDDNAKNIHKVTSGAIAGDGDSFMNSGSREPYEPVVVTRDEIDSYIKNPNKIWRNIRIQEIRKNGQIDGFRVNYVKKGSFFDQSGLKSGDIIKAIDGNEIKSLSDVMKYYNDIKNLDGLSLTVLRGGNEVELEFNIN